MFDKWSRVRLLTNYKRFVTPDMKEWIDNHKFDDFVVENQIDESVKLKRVDFWITSDLLTKYEARMFTPEIIEKLNENEVFVFGSNEQGRHGRGAALTAKQKFDAVEGQGIGMTGQCYALATCTWINSGKQLIPLGLNKIKEYADQFIDYAKYNPEQIFYLTKVGCGLAGFTINDIAPLFKDVINVKNIIMPIEFYDIIKDLE